MSKYFFIVCFALTARPLLAQNYVGAYKSSVFAGSPETPTITDGLGVNARFQSITSMWGNGNDLYVADARTVRHIDLTTTVVTTLSQTASSGLPHTEPPGSGNLFASYDYVGLYGLWGQGSFLYGTDIGANTLRQINLATGGVQTIAQPFYPWGLSGDGANLYVNNASHGQITQINPVTGASSEFAVTGSGTPSTCIGGSGCIGYFVPGPRSSWSDGQNIYVSGYSGTVMEINIATGAQTLLPAAPFNVGAIAGTTNQLFVAAISGAQLGSISLPSGTFTALPVPPGASSIAALWSDGAGLYVAIGGPLSGQAVERIDLTTGNVVNIAGYVPIRQFTDGVGGAARFQNPQGVWGDGQSLYVADTANFTIRKVDLATATVTTFAGQPNRSTILDGIGTAAAFLSPVGIWGDGTNLYVIDANSIRSINLATAQVTTLAGSATAGAMDGAGATARFYNPLGLWGTVGMLYIADYGNSVIRQLDLATNQVSTLAGGYGISAPTDGVGLKARFVGPIALWGEGSTLYVGSEHAVRTISLNTAQVQTFSTLPPTNNSAQELWGNGSGLYVLETTDVRETLGLELYRIDLITGAVSSPIHDASDSEAGLPFVFPGGNVYPVEAGIWGDGTNLFITDSADNTIRLLAPAPLPTLTQQQVTNPGYASNTTPGTAATLSVGYAEPVEDSGNATLSGFAIFELRQNGILISEATVPAAPAILSGRILSSTMGLVSTGVAIANPNAASAVISYYFTDAAGNNYGQGTFTLPGGNQIARFLTQDPFDGPASPDGTFTFVSSVPISALALRCYVNQRSEFLMTTLSVLDLSQQKSGPLTVTHFAAGGGWITELDLVNPSDQPISGTVQLLGASVISVGGTAGILVGAVGSGSSAFGYLIPPRTVQEFDFVGDPVVISTGAFQVLPQNQLAPGVVAIFSLVESGIRVSEASVPDVPSAPAFHMYAEVSPYAVPGSPESTRSGFAITNTSSTPEDINVQLTASNGATFYTQNPSSLNVSIHVDALSHVSMFFDEITALSGMTDFAPAYVVRLSTATPAGFSVVGIRGVYNERGDFLITTTPAVVEDIVPDLTPRYIAHIVDGGGYSTEFVFFSATAQSTTSGFTVTTSYFGQTGTPLPIPNQ